MSNEIYYGEIIFFLNKKGFGFISWNKDGVKQKDLFLHYTGINSSGFRTVSAGQKVQFELGLNNNNLLKAINLSVIS